MFCIQCGTQNPDGSAFCSQCGSAVPVSLAASPVPSQPVLAFCVQCG
ncbi:MAG TPA: zinc-ribbon domain-containing protein, partial [Candidatus Angelobacter sp.]